MHNHRYKKCCSYMPALLSGIIFSLIAAMDLVRVFMGWSVVVNGDEYPMWASILCAVITGAMAIWNFVYCCACKKCRDGKCETHDHDDRKIEQPYRTRDE